METRAVLLRSYLNFLLVLLFFFGAVSIKSIAQQRKVLLLGLSLEQLSSSARETLQNHQVIESSFFNKALLRSLILKENPSLVIIKQSSGIYAYLPNGQLIRALSTENLASVQQSSKPLFEPGERTDSSNYYIPGEQISKNLSTPGDTKYRGFLPGEGFNLRRAGRSNYAATRNTIKQLAKFSQAAIYPFWFDTFLQANTQFSSPQGGLTLGEPASVFRAETTANAAIVGSQLTSNALGIGSMLFDAYLDKRQIQDYENWSRNYSQGVSTRYYYQPEQSSNYYSAPRLDQRSFSSY